MMSKRRLMRKWSKSFLRDPSQMRRVTSVYENTLVHMWRNAKRRCMAEVFDRQLAVTQVEVTGVSEYDAQRDLVHVGLIIDAEVVSKAPYVVKKGIRQSYAAGNQRGAEFLGSVGIQATVGLGPVDENVIKTLEARNLAGLTKLKADVAAKIQQDIAEGIRRGEGSRDITKRIVAENIDGVGVNRARAIARTETMYAYNTASEESYRRHGVTEVEWLAAYDDRVCSHSLRGFDGKTYDGGCEALMGERFPIAEAPPHPLHVNCRCITMPVPGSVQ